MKELIIYLLFASVAYCEEKTFDESSNVPPIKTVEDEVKGPEEDNGVLVLTDDNFEATLKSKKLVLVEFYAPWCGHCKALAPEYEKAAKLLAERDPPLKGVLAKVDATVHTKAANKYSIRGYPTLKLFREGEEAGDFDSERNGDSIASFMAERIDPNYKPPPPVAITLTKDNFTEFITNNEWALVEFFTPLCGHCEQFAPIFERAAKRLKVEDPTIPLAVVDATQAEEIAAKYKVQVQDFPILKLFRKGEASDYKGRRDEAGIVKYMIQNRYDAYISVTTMKALKKSIPERRPLILGYFPAPSQDVLRQVMVEATNNLRSKYTSAITQESAIAKEFGLTEPSVILIQPELFHSKHEAKFIKFDAKSVTVEALQQFIEENQYPLVGHLTWDTMPFYDTIKNGTFCTVFFSVDFTFEHRKATQMWRQKLVEVAKDFKGKVVMAIANDEDFEDRIQTFNLVETGVDMNIGCLKRGIRYVMPEMDEYDADHIRSFLRDLVDGKAKPFLKSEKVPAKQTSPVMTAVADNYEKTVFDLKKDVLVEFYSPNCGHCQMFAPIYEKLAQRLSTIPSLSLIKMNAEANDVPPPLEPAEKITSFPTIYFRAAGSKDLVKFNDNRSLEKMIEFMAKYAITSKQALEAEVAADKKKEKDGGEAKEENKKDEL